ncbi:hypothetical protein EFP17_08400 [Burkholderia glumae]|nr:hypothetical protein EFP17_08400 [Burkholderia glumae]
MTAYRKLGRSGRFYRHARQRAGAARQGGQPSRSRRAGACARRRHGAAGGSASGGHSRLRLCAAAR